MNLPSSYSVSDRIESTYKESSFESNATLYWSTAPVLYHDEMDIFYTSDEKEIFWNNLISYYWESNISERYTDIISHTDRLELVTTYIQTW